MPRNLTFWSAATGTLKDSPQFEAQSVRGSEALGELFHYTAVLQTPDSPDLAALVAANLPYRQLVGLEAGLVIEVDANTRATPTAASHSTPGPKPPPGGFVHSGAPPSPWAGAESPPN